MTDRGTRIALLLALIATLLALIAVVLAAIALTRTGAATSTSAASADAPPPPPSPAPPPPSMDATTEPLAILDGTRIEYELSTDGMSVTSLSYVVWKDGAPTMVNDDGAPAPFRQVVDVPKGTDLADFSVTGVGGSTSHQVTCTIRVDGSVVDTQTASGAYPIVNCVAGKPAKG